MESFDFRLNSEINSFIITDQSIMREKIECYDLPSRNQTV